MNKKHFTNQTWIFCLARTPAYLFVLVVQQLASVAAVHPNVRVKVGVASCGGVRLGADWTGVYGVARVFSRVTWFFLVQAETFRVHLLQLPPF